MVRSALIIRPTVNLHSTWYKLYVRDKALMRLINITHDNLFHLNGLLLFLIFFITVKIGSTVGGLLAAFLDSMVG